MRPQPGAAPATLNLAGAVQLLAQDLAVQLRPQSVASVVVIDTILDRASGQQTEASMRLEAELAPALRHAIRGLELIPFDEASIARSPLVLTGTLALLEAPDRYAVSVALADRGSGLVVAQSAARFQERDLDLAPTRFYDDSPSLVRDRSIDGYLRTSVTAAGQPADALYLEQIPTAALLAQALEAYTLQHWEEALTRYAAAASRPDGQQLRTFNGLYLTNLRLSRLAEAEEAFGRVVALGLATNNLAVKLLFRPGSASEFWPSPELSGMYPMWLRQIAHVAGRTGSCLDIVGHASRSGGEEFNDRLSLARAETVKRLLGRERGELIDRSRARGLGYRENIIGTGRDDASDAVDRRVEFIVVPCD